MRISDWSSDVCSSDLVHVDAAQAYGKLPVDAALCDFISISAHKIYGPKGIGALWIRPGVAVAPFMHGGGQEGPGLRSGTLSPALCAGFGAAAAVAKARMEGDLAHVRSEGSRGGEECVRTCRSRWSPNQ